jgi:hypothetical protein
MYRIRVRWSRPEALLLALACLLAPAAAAAQVTIFYPPPHSSTDTRNQYPIRLLETALQKAGGHYRAAQTPLRMQQGRAKSLLQHGQGIDVVWAMTSIETEANLLPIRIPIFKGLISWRLLLIHQRHAEKFRQITSVHALQRMVAGQGHDWPDTPILRANGFRVHGSSDYGSLFNMLKQNRIDFFPRSIVEIWDEADTHRNDGIIVEPAILLRYPSAFYFFVNKKNTHLAAELTAGLEMMIQDGTFDRLFHEYHDDAIGKAGLKTRMIIELDNPILPPETPLGREALWFRK